MAPLVEIWIPVAFYAAIILFSLSTLLEAHRHA
jgi:hypothetical protein